MQSFIDYAQQVGVRVVNGKPVVDFTQSVEILDFAAAIA